MENHGAWITNIKVGFNIMTAYNKANEVRQNPERMAFHVKSDVPSHFFIWTPSGSLCEQCFSYRLNDECEVFMDTTRHNTDVHLRPDILPKQCTGHYANTWSHYEIEGHRKMHIIPKTQTVHTDSWICKYVFRHQISPYYIRFRIIQTDPS